MIRHKIGYHAINWGNDPDVHAMLQEISTAGYNGVELCHSSKIYGNSEQLNVLLGKIGLSVPAVIGVSQLIGKTAKDDIQAMRERIDYAASVMAKIFVIVAAKHSRDNIRADEYRELAENLDVLADYAAEYGMLLTVHNHMGYLIQTKEDIARLFEASSKVHLAFDTAHCAVAGDDCIDVIRNFGKRIKYVHLKDFAGKLPADNDWNSADFAELGQGTGSINFAAILGELKTVNYNGWLTVELDSVAARRSPAESAKISRDYLRQMGY